ncbi:hypothetical protein RND71_015282 [Anisodus tanguticus]|uniref:Uncharacterized protein n=1 Tax=Anisodus tanguticus TaxID=243964 RepID=A0AAE1VK50_9SOLA|nr:hypothetical protein RND71_015282 [Anisodus tanguticus]
MPSYNSFGLGINSSAYPLKASATKPIKNPFGANIPRMFQRFNLLYTKDASRSWKLVGSDESSCLKIKEPSANVVLLDYISSGKWKDIIDFDDDLDDISKYELYALD